MDPVPFLVEADGERCSIVAVRAQPGASRAGLAGVWNGMLKLRVHAPPDGGRANEELVALLARLTGLKRGQVELVRGATAREKRFRLDLPVEEVRARLEPLLRPKGGA